MAVTFEQYKTALRSKVRHPIYKVEILDFATERVVEEITDDFISGDLSINGESGSRRNCNISLVNKDGDYNPSVGSLWIDTKIRLWTGLQVNGEPYYNSQGIFLLAEPKVSSNFAEKVADLTFYDKWSYLDGTLGGELESEYIISIGDAIPDVIRAILTQAGDPKSPTITDTLVTVPYTIVKEAGNTYADLLLELANILTWVVYYDRHGNLRFEPPTDITTAGSDWDFSTNEVTYISGNKTLDYTKVRNYIVVYGDNINGELFSAIAQDTNATSPTRVALIGKRVKVLTFDLLYSDNLCQQRADYELQQGIMIFESVDAVSIPVDIIEGGSVVTITANSLGLNGDRFLINSINIPLSYDSNMSLNIWKTRELT